ncbi:MAG: DegT/DnrJ/EryC1/StrS family aminotransferase, partial [Desulfomonilia bacterium]|nr:DegT/DnrJ/EryC1/StrS family aminotransferase [Desulfomonilia bacterium]
ALEHKDPREYPLPRGFEQISARGIIPVDLFGQAADYDRINTLAKRKGLFVLEDAAQSFGAEYRGKKACALADVAATSFFPAKPLGCYGDGGMIFTDSDELSSKLDSIRVHGKGSFKYDNVRIGINGRCDTLQAAILLAKFEIFPEELTLRQEVAGRYTRLLNPVPGITCPVVAEGCLSAWAQYTLISDRKDQVMAALKQARIPTAIYYPKPLHLQTAYQYLDYKPGDFAVSEKSSEAVFSLPMHPYLTDQEQEEIVDVIRKA